MNTRQSGQSGALAGTMRARPARRVMTEEESYEIFETMASAMEFVHELGSWVVYQPAPISREERAADEAFDECFRSWLCAHGERYAALLDKMGDDVFTPLYYAWARAKTWSHAKAA